MRFHERVNRWALASALFMSASATLRAQSGEMFEQEETLTRVISLKNASAAQVVGVVHELFARCGFGVDHRTNSIVTTCPSKEVDAIQELVAKLDLPVDQEIEQAYLYVPRVTSGLREMVSVSLSRDARIAVDPESGTIGIRGTPADIARAHEVIGMMDANRRKAASRQTVKSNASYQVHLYFVTAQFGDKDEKGDLPALPARLEPVGSTLSDHGFQRPGLLASMVVLSHPGQEFELEGSVDLTDMGDAAKIEVEVEGALRSDDGDAVAFELSSKLARRAAESLGGGYEEIFELNTTIQCGLNEYLVLSASPAGARLFDAVALVVHVTR